LKVGDFFRAILYEGHFHYYVPKKYRGNGYAKELATMACDYLLSIGKKIQTEIYGETRQQHDASEHIVRDVLGMTVNEETGRYELIPTIRRGESFFNKMWKAEEECMLGVLPKNKYNSRIEQDFLGTGEKVAVKLLAEEVLLVKPICDYYTYICILNKNTHSIQAMFRKDHMFASVDYCYISYGLKRERESKLFLGIIVPVLKKAYEKTKTQELRFFFDYRYLRTKTSISQYLVSDEYNELSLELKKNKNNA
jgi:hypothetical protein